jgi:hypothetical protein
MNPRSVQQIGKKFANWCNDQYEQMGLGIAANTPGSGSGKKKGDSYNAGQFLMEFKSERNPSWKGNIAQARRQAQQGNYDHDKWLLVQRDPATPQNNPQAFAILDYIEFLKLLKRNAEPMVKEPDRDARRRIERAQTATKSVMKILEENRNWMEKWEFKRLVEALRDLEKIF